MKRLNKKNKWVKKHLLGIEDLSKDEILEILDTTEGFKEVLKRPIPKVPTLRGKTIVFLFCEPSTRTKASFDLAAKRLSADTVQLNVSSSSFQKGETLKDAARNLEAINIDMIVIRHSAAGAALFLSQCVEASVINAGDGSHEHPTQALLDAYTIRDKIGQIKGLRVCIVGDIAHSRVARSNIWALKKLGAEVSVCGPRTMMPVRIEDLGVKVYSDIDKAIKENDCLNVLRIQLERFSSPLFPSTQEYVKMFGITKERLDKKGNRDTLILHPGPINRGVELSQDVADGKNAVILDQVTNGVAVRMAIMYLLGTVK